MASLWLDQKNLNIYNGVTSITNSTVTKFTQKEFTGNYCDRRYLFLPSVMTWLQKSTFLPTCTKFKLLRFGQSLVI